MRRKGIFLFKNSVIILRLKKDLISLLCLLLKLLVRVAEDGNIGETEMEKFEAGFKEKKEIYFKNILT